MHNDKNTNLSKQKLSHKSNNARKMNWVINFEVRIENSIVLKNTVAMLVCDLGWSRANIYGSSVGWLENTRMSTQPICYLKLKESK